MNKARTTLNDSDRSQWIDNDEGLYRWWKSTRLTKREFIKQNRAELDKSILSVVNGNNKAHFLIYG